ncbi:MAG: glycosyltransferase family A protein [Candidatus Nanopelagicales bacterium]
MTDAHDSMATLDTWQNHEELPGAEVATAARRQSLVVAIPTYRRAQLLTELLPSLLSQAASVKGLGIDADVLVIDNDPQGSAADTVLDAQQSRDVLDVGAPQLRYVLEPHPGISAARNMALDASSQYDFLVFIDDDERPSATWLLDLVGVQREFRAEGVLGPVLAEYMSPPDPWIEAGGFFVRPRQKTGSTREVGFTGNLLLDLHAVRGLGIRFDEEFGLSGGEDSLFTSLLTRGGGVIRWCDEAAVWDLVPTERATRRWVLTRRFRSGTSHSRVALRLEESSATRRSLLRVSLTVGGGLRLGLGLVRWAVGMIIRSDRLQARGLRTSARGAGMAMGAWGYLHREYRRPPGGESST